uniref:Uncharacterized protein n=1 Tax=Oryza punctata TaxID=4537 RepID=A0A0E0LJV0_ORYPU
MGCSEDCEVEDGRAGSSGSGRWFVLLGCSWASERERRLVFIPQPGILPGADNEYFGGIVETCSDPTRTTSSWTMDNTPLVHKTLYLASMLGAEDGADSAAADNFEGGGDGQGNTALVLERSTHLGRGNR